MLGRSLLERQCLSGGHQLLERPRVGRCCCRDSTQIKIGVLFQWTFLVTYRFGLSHLLDTARSPLAVAYFRTLDSGKARWTRVQQGSAGS